MIRAIYMDFAESAAPRSGVSDLVTVNAFPPTPPKNTKFNKLIEPRARRASPQGHGKSLPDAVKTIAFPEVLEGFRPKPTANQRPANTPPHSVHEVFP